MQRHEIYALARLFGGNYSGEKHCPTETQFYGAVGLLGQFAGLDGNLATIGQCDGFLNYIHKFFLYFLLLQKFVQSYDIFFIY